MEALETWLRLLWFSGQRTQVPPRRRCACEPLGQTETDHTTGLS